MPGKPPYFPFYPRDFASDGKVEAMTTEEVGAYTLLLCKAWLEEPAGSIPSDDAILTRWARLDAATWAKCRAAVLAPFVLGSDGRYYQPRMREEYAKLRRTFKGKSEGGKRGARKRWGQDTPDGIANGNPNGIPIAKPMGAASASVSESPGKGVQGEGSALPPSLDTPEFRSAWQAWVTYRREKRKKLTPSTIAKQIKQLAEWGSSKAVMAIESSIRNGWQGLFEPEESAEVPEPTPRDPVAEIHARRAEIERARREAAASREAAQGATHLFNGIDVDKLAGGKPCPPPTE